jgi:hypothetical protein
MTKITILGTAILSVLAVSVSTPVSAVTFIRFNSEPGDFIGGGITQTFTPIDGFITASGNFKNGVSISFHGDDWWNLHFAPPQGSSLVPGTYKGATRFPFQEPTEPGLDVSGAGRGCESTGQFNVLNAIYGADGSVERFDADFEQRCRVDEPALFGQVRFNLADSKASPEEIKQNIQLQPTELEKLLAFSDKIQEFPTALYLWSEPGDYIGGGLERIFTPEEVDFNVSRNFPGGVSFFINNDFSRSEADNSIWWNLDFAPPVDLPLIPGGYGKATGSNSPTKPRIRVIGDSIGCGSGRVAGKFVVLDAAYKTDGSVKRFDSIFEQRCEGQEGTLFGRIRYNETVAVVPEATSPLSLLTLATLSAASTFKRKLKPSKSAEKELKKVS